MAEQPRLVAPRLSARSFLQTLVYLLGLLLIGGVSRSVFEGESNPPDSVRGRTFTCVRPITFFTNARNSALLTDFITAQVPSYVKLRSPTIIITGDCDPLVSPKINACGLVPTLPSAKLVAQFIQIEG